MPVRKVQRDGTRQTLERTFLRRSMSMLERLSASASPEALHSALASPSDIGGVAAFLSDLAPLGVDLSSVDPFAEALARGAVIKQELLTKAGGGLTASQVAAALGITRQGVDKRRSRATLLFVPTGSGEYLYPACQFAPDGVVRGLERVLEAFSIQDPWTRLSVLQEPAPALGGHSILESLQSGAIERAAAVAQAYGEQGG